MVARTRKPAARLKSTRDAPKPAAKGLAREAETVPDEGRKEDILAATLHIAASEGFDKISIRKVASVAGVSPSLITYHYKTKTRLIAEAWWLLHDRESRRRDETIGRVSGLKRIDEGFRLAFEAPEDEVSPQLRLDFWSKTSRTPSLLDLLIKHEQSLLESHIAGLQTSIEDGDLKPDLGDQLDVVEDLIQAFTFGIHTWASLHNSPQDSARALKVGRLFINLLGPSR